VVGRNEAPSRSGSPPRGCTWEVTHCADSPAAKHHVLAKRDAPALTAPHVNRMLSTSWCAPAGTTPPTGGTARIRRGRCSSHAEGSC
jgi:hypothetical protein